MFCQGLISVKIAFVYEIALEALFHFFKLGCLFCHDFEGHANDGENRILLLCQLALHWLDKYIVNFTHCHAHDFIRELRLVGGEVFVNIHFSIVPCVCGCVEGFCS